MDTNQLKKFAQEARKQLMREVRARMQQVRLVDSVERHQKADILEDLEKRIKKSNEDQVVEAVAYTWFNRLCALRYMDVNGFNRIGTVSPAAGATQPEILQEAKAGYIEDNLPVKRQEVLAYLNNTKTVENPQQEAYRLLLVAVCNQLAEPMPFLFTRIEDYTQLLMPLDLLSENSVVNKMRQVLTEETCRDVEVIGWLYQFYISEKKDEVMARNGAVPSEDIPAVTQLFTPHWIVQYMVENSLGRLWLLNHPDSRLAEKMEYYINPSPQDSLTPAPLSPEGRGDGGEGFIHLSSPEEIRLCDPACGSGHILTYAFDLLYAIYEEMGYDPVRIPTLILEHNLYGIEIDQRAGSLAAFALYMKAYEKDRRFARRGVHPQICVMEDITFSAVEIKTYMEKLGSDLFTQDLWEGLKQFEDATTYGSLIRPKVRNPQVIRERMQERGVFNDLFLYETNRKVEKVLEMITFLSPRYQVVVANPPYFGGMDGEYKQFAKDFYPDSKSDTFAMFMERNLDLVKSKGLSAMINMQSWMFLSSYEGLRKRLLEHETFLSMVHLGPRAFDTIGGEVVSTTMFVLQHGLLGNNHGDFFRLVDGNSEAEKIKNLKEAIANPECGWFFRASAADFKKIPGSPIAYWVSDYERNQYTQKQYLEKFANPKKGLDTGENEKFLRLWHEISLNKSSLYDFQKNKKWYPYNKGGEFRRWYGNREFVINWSENGKEIKSRTNLKKKKPTLRNQKYYFQEGFTWTTVSSSSFSARYTPVGALFDNGGCTLFSKQNLYLFGGYINSNVAKRYFEFLSPTLNFQPGSVGKLLFFEDTLKINPQVVKKCIDLSKQDWDDFETSWDFSKNLLLEYSCNSLTIRKSYSVLRSNWQSRTENTLHLEEENNRIFIEAYGLEDELTPEVPLSEITLTCNPHYRYPDTSRKKYTDEKREARLLEDTIKEFLSYAVGCMFGRYSLDKPGLILANQGETVEDYLNKIGTTTPTFTPDEDNVIPILDGDWFPDDITNRFKSFLKVTFGEENYEDNLIFIENALGKDVRSYFVRDFYKDHVQMYKKRPIYWLFSSPKGSFNALIYMHRYRTDTISVLLNKYLREYQTKLRARREYLAAVERDPTASKKDKTAAQKETRSINQTLLELREYENEIIYPLATAQISIDLDDGVKVNYAKFGKALKGI